MACAVEVIVVDARAVMPARVYVPGHSRLPLIRLCGVGADGDIAGGEIILTAAKEEVLNMSVTYCQLS